ncbi:MAG: 4-hydroxy-tetrahydrodipicolinate reductase [Flavobacteriales bacterium]
MKIGLIGYGKMGKAIEEIALERGHVITAVINRSNPLTAANWSEVDVAIEFTQPDLAVSHINYCLENNVPIVVGTTAWQSELPKVEALTNKKNGSLLHASNFSIGVNLFFEINRKLAEMMNRHPEYKVSMEEIHHVQKLDAPSGTAVSLANDIIAHHHQYKTWQLSTEVTEDASISINALRQPNVPGTHEVRYDSEIDTIRIEHIAHNRKGFALGAVLAAEFLAGKKGVFTMKDVLK